MKYTVADKANVQKCVLSCRVLFYEVVTISVNCEFLLHKIIWKGNGCDYKDDV